MIRVLLIGLSFTVTLGVLAENCDLERGKSRYQKCVMCHGPLSESVAHGIGPSLFNVVGRQAGSALGFGYSAAMLDSGLVWDLGTLDAFLAAPNEVVGGTSMAFRGVKNESDRHDLVCYLGNKAMRQ